MLICMRKRLCKQACNTLFHINQRMTELQQNNKMSDVIKIPHQTSYVNVLSEN